MGAINNGNGGGKGGGETGLRNLCDERKNEGIIQQFYLTFPSNPTLLSPNSSKQPEGERHCERTEGRG